MVPPRAISTLCSRTNVSCLTSCPLTSNGASRAGFRRIMQGGSQTMSKRRSQGASRPAGMTCLKASIWCRGPTAQLCRSRRRCPKQRRPRGIVVTSTADEAMHSRTMSMGVSAVASKSCVRRANTLRAMSPKSCARAAGRFPRLQETSFATSGLSRNPGDEPERFTLLASGDCDRNLEDKSTTVRAADSAVLQSCKRSSHSRAFSRTAVIVPDAASWASRTPFRTEVPVPARFETQGGIAPAPSLARKAEQKWQQFRVNKS
mmetsp:Transcript_41737/g.116284  ORF Transcript_41737/g.116284 Transcript_41737/m.116284 type:complete len:261 (+) Transcript_41737:364-1146(+)